MRDLSKYTEKPMSELMKKHGAFYAFSTKQFDEQKVPGEKYVSYGMGLIMPKKVKATKYFDELQNIIDTAQKQRIKDFGMKAIIKYELYNYECFYTGSIEDAYDILKDYGATKEEVLKIFREEYKNYNEC